MALPIKWSSNNVSPTSLNDDAGTYLETTRKSIYSIVLLLPLFIIYAIGVTRGALGGNIHMGDWIIRFIYLNAQAFLGKTLITIITSLIIIGSIAYATYTIYNKQIRLKWTYFIGMYGEAMAAALLISLLEYLALNRQLPQLFTFTPADSLIAQFAVPGVSTVWTRIVTSVGAGIFEELLIRVALLGTWIYIVTGRGPSEANIGDQNVMKAILGTSVIFTLGHLGMTSLLGLIPIFITSIILSLIYLRRGYGIVACVHVFYDLYIFFGVVS